MTFAGGASTVTGSKFLIDGPRYRILVDCGLFQGLKELRLRNREPFTVPPASIDAVLLTHAHIDHCGYLPALVRNGFRGSVYATYGTKQLCRIVLPDAARLQEEEASHANRMGYSKHAPALPLYTERDAKAALKRFESVSYGVTIDVGRGVRAEFRRAGHILGSASIVVSFDDGRSVLFSGDLGRPEHPILRGPEPPAHADHIVVESTYGDRSHDDASSLDRFRDAIVRTVERGGVVVIPAFAVDRTEVLLYHLRRLVTAGEVPRLPVYVDSPMALSALDVYRRAINEDAADVRTDLERGVDLFDPGELIEVRSVQASKAVNDVRDPCIIVSASGMATGGRVLHHLTHRLPDPKNTVMLVGFQTAGTRGRSLRDGATAVKMLGRYVPVRAEVVDVGGFSVHADADEVIAWLKSAKQPPVTSYVVHGEAAASAMMRDRMVRELGWTAAVPGHLERVRLD